MTAKIIKIIRIMKLLKRRRSFEIKTLRHFVWNFDITFLFTITYYS